MTNLQLIHRFSLNTSKILLIIFFFTIKISTQTHTVYFIFASHVGNNSSTISCLVTVALLYYLQSEPSSPELQSLDNFHPCILHRRTDHEDETVNKHLYYYYFFNKRKYSDNIIMCTLLLDGDIRKHV